MLLKINLYQIILWYITEALCRLIYSSSLTVDKSRQSAHVLIIWNSRNHPTGKIATSQNHIYLLYNIATSHNLFLSPVKRKYLFPIIKASIPLHQIQSLHIYTTLKYIHALKTSLAYSASSSHDFDDPINSRYPPSWTLLYSPSLSLKINLERARLGRKSIPFARARASISPTSMWYDDGHSGLCTLSGECLLCICLRRWLCV